MNYELLYECFDTTHDNCKKILRRGIKEKMCFFIDFFSLDAFLSRNSNNLHFCKLLNATFYNAICLNNSRECISEKLSSASEFAKSSAIFVMQFSQATFCNATFYVICLNKCTLEKLSSAFRVREIKCSFCKATFCHACDARGVILLF